MRVFVSSQSVDHPPASVLIEGLRRAGVEVGHSPRNPLDGDDPRWTDWYAVGLAAAIARSDAFVIVVERGWDSATWMGIEAEAWLLDSLRDSPGRCCFWNPGGLVVALGMRCYLREELPQEPGAAIARLLERTGHPGLPGR